MKQLQVTNLFRKTLCALLATLLAASLCGCSGGSDGENGFQALFKLDGTGDSASEPREPTPVTELDLPYDPSDTHGGRIFDPYYCQTSANRYICALVYDPLFRIDGSYQPQPCIAESAEYSSVALSEHETAYFCVVTLREGALFSDGDEVTAADVLYSISLAMAKDSVFATKLSNVVSYTRSEPNRITFRLHSPDAMFASLLCFPIVKKGSGDNQAYVGSGRYRPILVGESVRLLQNEHYSGSGPIRLISLVEVEDGNMLMYGLKTGSIDFAFFDFSADMSYSAASGSQLVQLNNMIFIGVNGYSRQLADAAVRRAVSLTIDRSALVSAYSGMATAAYTPQNPLFSNAKPDAPDRDAAEALLTQAGFERDEEGFFAKRDRRLTLRLLVNSEDDRRIAAASLIAEQLNEVGLETELVEKPFSEYSALLAAGDYDLYLGELRLKYNMSIAALLPGGQAAYSTAADEEFMAAYLKWRSGGSLGSFNSAFAEQTPFIPLLFRCGLVSFSRSLSYDIVSTEQDIFYNIIDW